MNIMNNSQSNNPQRFLDYSLFNYLSRKIQPLLYIKRDNSLNPLLSPEQLALGFNEYVCSDEFKLKIKNYNDNRRQFFCEKIRQNENIKTNVNLTNIKQTIREKILNANSVTYI